jgi:TetR/AcrR family transcriptional regulator, transcriptional repressor for nem operon
MPRDAMVTRTRIMDAAEALIMRQGVSATTVDQIIERAQTTKGTFFYHFKTKLELAHALVARWAALDEAHLHATMDRAKELAVGPRQQLLVFAGLLVELAESLQHEDSPGCLFSCYLYEAELFDADTMRCIRDTMYAWRDAVAALVRAAVAEHPPRQAVDPESLADMITALFDGAFIMVRATGERELLSAQLRHYRDYLRLLFAD